MSLYNKHPPFTTAKAVRKAEGGTFYIQIFHSSPPLKTSSAVREAEGGDNPHLSMFFFSAPKGQDIPAMGEAHRDNGTTNLALKGRNQRTNFK